MIVVYEPEGEHVCAPGWTERPIDRTALYAPPFDVALVPPTPWQYPRGTVVLCDCGKTWVSEGARYLNEPGRCYFRREGRIARWWRERSQ